MKYNRDPTKGKASQTFNLEEITQSRTYVNLRTNKAMYGKDFHKWNAPVIFRQKTNSGKIEPKRPVKFKGARNFEETSLKSDQNDDENEKEGEGGEAEGENGRVKLLQFNDNLSTKKRILYTPMILQPGFYTVRLCLDDLQEGDSKPTPKQQHLSPKSYYFNRTTDSSSVLDEITVSMLECGDLFDEEIVQRHSKLIMRLFDLEQASVIEKMEDGKIFAELAKKKSAMIEERKKRMEDRRKSHGSIYNHMSVVERFEDLIHKVLPSSHVQKQKKLMDKIKKWDESIFPGTFVEVTKSNDLSLIGAQSWRLRATQQVGRIGIVEEVKDKLFTVHLSNSGPNLAGKGKKGGEKGKKQKFELENLSVFSFSSPLITEGSYVQVQGFKLDEQQYNGYFGTVTRIIQQGQFQVKLANTPPSMQQEQVFYSKHLKLAQLDAVTTSDFGSDQSFQWQNPQHLKAGMTTGRQSIVIFEKPKELLTSEKIKEEILMIIDQLNNQGAYLFEEISEYLQKFDEMKKTSDVSELKGFHQEVLQLQIALELKLVIPRAINVHLRRLMETWLQILTLKDAGKDSKEDNDNLLENGAEKKMTVKEVLKSLLDGAKKCVKELGRVEKEFEHVLVHVLSDKLQKNIHFHHFLPQSLSALSANELHYLIELDDAQNYALNCLSKPELLKEYGSVKGEAILLDCAESKACLNLQRCSNLMEKKSDLDSKLKKNLAQLNLHVHARKREEAEEGIGGSEGYLGALGPPNARPQELRVARRSIVQSPTRSAVNRSYLGQRCKELVIKIKDFMKSQYSLKTFGNVHKCKKV